MFYALFRPTTSTLATLNCTLGIRMCTCCEKVDGEPTALAHRPFAYTVHWMWSHMHQWSPLDAVQSHEILRCCGHQYTYHQFLAGDEITKDAFLNLSKADKTTINHQTIWFYKRLSDLRSRSFRIFIFPEDDGSPLSLQALITGWKVLNPVLVVSAISFIVLFAWRRTSTQSNIFSVTTGHVVIFK